MEQQHSTNTAEASLAAEGAGFTAARGAALRLVSYALGTIASIISTKLLLHYLSVPDTADYAVVIAILAIVSGVADAGMTTVGVQEYLRRQGKARVLLLRNLLGMRMCVVVFGVVVATLFAFLQGYSSVMVWGVVIGGLGNVLVIFATTLTVPLQAALRFSGVALLELLRQVSLAFILIIFILLKGSLLSLLAVPLPAGCVLLLATLLTVRNRQLWLPAFHWQRWREFMKTAGLFSLVATVATVYFFITQILLSHIVSKFEAGIYAASFRVFITLIAVPGLVVTSFFPILTHASHTEDKKRFEMGVKQLTQLCLLIAGFTVFSVVLLSPFIIDVLARDEFHGSVAVLRIHGCALAGTFLATSSCFSLLALDRTRALLGISLIGLAVNIVAVIVLAHFDGARGAAFANLAGELTLAFGGWVVLFKAGIRFNLYEMIRAVVPFIAVMPIFLFDLQPIFLAYLLGTGVFLGTAVVTQAVPRSLLQKIIGR